ncbi:hypothetical protein HN709_04465 [Candidatus Peregrinibacteria bacterium]|nr:hypothetical protein [Candidatus Peregrinibacteria bacterium]
MVVWLMLVTTIMVDAPSPLRNLDAEELTQLRVSIEDRISDDHALLNVESVSVYMESLQIDDDGNVSGELIYKVQFVHPGEYESMVDSCDPGSVMRGGRLSISGTLDDFNLAPMDGLSYINAFAIAGDPNEIMKGEIRSVLRSVRSDKLNGGRFFTLDLPIGGARVYEIIDEVISATDFVLKSITHHVQGRLSGNMVFERCPAN